MLIDKDGNATIIHQGDKVIYYKKKGIVKFKRGRQFMALATQDGYEVKLHHEGSTTLDIFGLRSLFRILSGLDLDITCMNDDYEIYQFM